MGRLRRVSKRSGGRVLGGLVTRPRQRSPPRCTSSPREPLLLAWPAWGAVAVSPGLISPVRPPECDARQTPQRNAAGSTPLVMWFFIVGGLIVPRPLPADCELGIRSLALCESWRTGQPCGAGWRPGRGRCERASAGVMGLLLACPLAKVQHKFLANEPWPGGPPASLSGQRAMWVSLGGVADESSPLLSLGGSRQVTDLGASHE